MIALSQPDGRPMQAPVVLAAAALLLAAAWAAAEEGGVRLAAAVAIGAVGGAALYHAAFGFTGAWRRLQRERRGAGVRAQMLLMAVAASLSIPLIAYGDAVGLSAGGWVFPMGLASAIGAAMFGFGMQLGGGCGSGVLFTLGGGSTRMALTLLAFLAGSVLWTATFDIWRDLPRLGSVSLIRTLGAPGAWAATMAALAALAWASVVIERRRHGALEPLGGRPGALLSGPWSRLFGALVLAGVVIATFLTLGRPWGVTSAYPLWGAKLGDAVGLPVRDIAFWSGDRLDAPLFGHATGVMNFGLMLGALAAAGAAGAFAPTLRLSARDAATAIIGGLLMGYGARLAFGCNIGGMVGGVVSASLHGWWWLAFGALGSLAGVRARAWIGMDPRN